MIPNSVLRILILKFSPAALGPQGRADRVTSNVHFDFFFLSENLFSKSDIFNLKKGNPAKLRPTEKLAKFQVSEKS